MTQSATIFSNVLSRGDWELRRAEHLAKIQSWADERVYRANHHQPHPVYDFLFTYYSFRPVHLKRWSPGADVVLQDASTDELDWPQDFVKSSEGWVIPSSSFPAHRRDYLRWAIRYLTATQSRPPAYHCFGLHEWAMVYKSETLRYEEIPLRLTPQEIAGVVESSGLRCTHYDAFRFFTPAAVPLNRSLLQRQTTSDFDQRGCVHVTMDLYRFANKIAPWCPGELVADTFLLAVDARTIDMRASPYDLQAFGFAPLEVETPSGREQYVQEQRRLAERAVPLRERLLDVYFRLAEASSPACMATGISDEEIAQ